MGPVFMDKEHILHLVQLVWYVLLPFFLISKTFYYRTFQYTAKSLLHIYIKKGNMQSVPFVVRLGDGEFSRSL